MIGGKSERVAVHIHFLPVTTIFVQSTYNETLSDAIAFTCLREIEPNFSGLWPKYVLLVSISIVSDAASAGSENWTKSILYAMIRSLE
jgi:hypothetical protein